MRTRSLANYDSQDKKEEKCFNKVFYGSKKTLSKASSSQKREQKKSLSILSIHITVLRIKKGEETENIKENLYFFIIGINLCFHTPSFHFYIFLLLCRLDASMHLLKISIFRFSSSLYKHRAHKVYFYDISILCVLCCV